VSWVEHWERVKREALALVPDAGLYSEEGRKLIAYFRWVDQQCYASGMHRLSPWWRETLEKFLASGKLTFLARVGVRGGKSDAISRVVVALCLLQERVLPRGTVGVCPIISNAKQEGKGRGPTLEQILNACGLVDERSKTAGRPTYSIVGGQLEFEIALKDAQGHAIALGVKAARVQSSLGYTGICAFLDEVDAWGAADGANPAEQVISNIKGRFGTQPQARTFIVSASYSKGTHHAKIMREGENEFTFVPTIGAAGALADEITRLEFAVKRKLTDKVLLAPGDAASHDIPAWVTNPATLLETLYTQSEGKLDVILQLNGGRESGWNRKGGKEIAPVDCAAFVTANTLAEGTRRWGGDVSAFDERTVL
jgi:hypothetical protein